MFWNAHVSDLLEKARVAEHTMLISTTKVEHPS